METPVTETFRTSPAGIRFQRNQTMALIGGIVVGNALVGILPGFLHLGHPVSLILLAALTLYLLYGRFLGSLRPGTEVTVGPETVQFRNRESSRQILLSTLSRIRIIRGPRGLHRKVHIWNDVDEAYVLLDPEEGAALEQWADEVARPCGVPVQVTLTTGYDRSPWIAFASTAMIIVLASLLASMW